jgi:probable F420-dependent oxidoreductase
MKFGAVFPQTEIGTDPQAMRRYARGAEELGFNYILAYEHILGAERQSYPNQSFIFDHEDAFHEPFTLFSYLAACTDKMEFTTGILILPQRDVRLVAKQAAQLALLSQGRFRLGVGGGWNRAESESLNADFSTRGKRMNEQLELLERLFREPLVDFDGQFHQVKRCGLNPLPNPAPPIWIGGSADAVLKRAARFADGWIAATLPPGQEQTIVDKLHHFLAERDRDPANFGLDARIVFAKFPPQERLAEFDRWKKLGATHFRCNTMGLGFTEVDQHLEALEQFLKVVKDV